MMHQPLDDLELETLENFLDSDQVHEECHNFITAHGFLTALSISPATLPQEQWQTILFEELPQFASEKEEQKIRNLLTRLQLEIQKELESEDDFFVPCDLELAEHADELSELQEWASGFMEGVFLTESHWFASEQEDRVAELLLPFMVASDLFDDEDVMQIRSNPKLTQSCIEQIPAILTDLYLIFRTEPEKKVNQRKTSHKKKSGKNKPHTKR
ncbi:YecA family protein [Marinomonas agarivorans]|nr:YecA family protein [Marinomonas agarivorans]